VEQRIPPSLEWVKLTTDLRETEFKVTKYSVSKDHYFRVRAANEFGIAEPSMPAMIRKKEGSYFPVLISYFSKALSYYVRR